MNASLYACFFFNLRNQSQYIRFIFLENLHGSKELSTSNRSIRFYIRFKFSETLIGLKEFSSSNGSKSSSAIKQDNPLKTEISHLIQFDEKDSISIGGMDILPDGGLLIIDINKCYLYRSDSLYKIVRTYKLPGNPCDVRYIGDGNAVVCIDYKYIMIVNVLENIIVRGPVNIDVICAGITCHDDLLYIADFQGSVYTITTDNTSVKSVLYESKHKMEPQRTCIAVSND